MLSGLDARDAVDLEVILPSTSTGRALTWKLECAPSISLRFGESSFESEAFLNDEVFEFDGLACDTDATGSFVCDAERGEISSSKTSAEKDTLDAVVAFVKYFETKAWDATGPIEGWRLMSIVSRVYEA